MSCTNGWHSSEWGQKNGRCQCFYAGSFLLSICVYVHVCVYPCLSLWHVVSNVFWMSFGGWPPSLSSLGTSLQGTTPLKYFCVFLLVSHSLLPSPHHMLMAHIIFPFHHPKNKISLDFSSDFSLSLDEVPAIYIFVCRREWGTYK